MFPNEFEIFPTNPLPLPNNLPTFIPKNDIFDVGNSLNLNSQQQLLSSAEKPLRTMSLINNLINVDNDENLINNITDTLKDLDINLENLSTNNLLTTNIQLAVKDFLTGSVSTDITLEQIAILIDANIDINSAAGLAELFEVLELLNIDVKPPEITAELANDTGADNTDNITSDPTIIGTVTDNSEIASLTVGLNETPTEDFVDITAEITETGNFKLDQEFLENLLGEPLTNDTYLVKFKATDEHGLEQAEIDRPGPEILSLAEIYGLDTYPDAIALTPTSARQLSVKIDGWVESPELTTDIEDITYTIADGDIVEVSNSGLITATGVGETTITVEYGEVSATIPVLVDEPEAGAAIVDENGGIVEGSDGALVMVAPGALTEETLVNLTPLEQQNLSMPIPEGLEFVGAFELELGETPLNEPAQLAIPTPADLEEGSGVLFLRKGQMPDASGTWRDTWLIEEIGVAGNDGMIRTTSFPYPGITYSGEYVAFLLPSQLEGINAIIPFKNPPYVTPTQQNVSDYTAWLDEIRELINVTGALNGYQYLGARAGLVGLIATSYAQFLLKSVLAAYVATLDNSSLDIISCSDN